MLALQFVTDITLTVKSFVYDDSALCDFIANKVVEYVKAQLEENIVALSIVSRRIHEQLSEYVNAVSISGFNSNEDLAVAPSVDEKLQAYNRQFFNVIDSANKLSIRRIVYVDDRKLLKTRSGVTVTFIK